MTPKQDLQKRGDGNGGGAEFKLSAQRFRQKSRTKERAVVCKYILRAGSVHTLF